MGIERERERAFCFKTGSSVGVGERKLENKLSERERKVGKLGEK